MRNFMMTVSIHGWPGRLAGVLLALLVAACAGPYKGRLDMASPPGVGIAEGTRIAAQAMQDIGFWPKLQNEAAGLVTGEKTDKIFFGWETMTITLQVALTTKPGGGLSVDAVCSVSKNMAYWDEGDECVEAFRAAFDKRLADWRMPAPVMMPAYPARPAPVMPLQPARPPAAPTMPPSGREYDL